MKNFAKSAVVFLSPLFVADVAAAQGSDWNYEASIYFFAAESTSSITTGAGTIEGTLPFSDALENLDFAFMGAFGARSGRWSLLADFIYLDLSFANSTPGPAFSGLNTDLELQVLNGYVAYRVFDDPSVQLDVAGGFRWFSVDTAMTLTPGALPGRTSRVNDDWVDPVVGLRTRIPFSDRWSGTAFLDYGGFSSDSETWQALFTADYALNDKWLLRGGYRHLSVDHDVSNGNFTLDQSGLIFGATYRF